MKHNDINKIKQDVENLAADLIMLDSNTHESLKSFIRNLQSACIAIHHDKLKTLKKVFNLMIEYIDECEQTNDTKKIYDILLASMANLQNHLNNNSIDLDSINNLNDIEALFKSIIKTTPDHIINNVYQINDNSNAETVNFIHNILSAINETEKIAIYIDSHLDDENSAHIISLFNFFYNLKNGAESHGILSLENIAKEAEAIIEEVLKGDVKLTKQISELFINIVDVTGELLFMLSQKTEMIVDKPQKENKPQKEEAQKHNKQESQKKPRHNSFHASPPVLNLEENGELLCEFISESRDHLVNAENSLLALEKSSNSEEEINRIFRAFHTIKGTSGFLQLSDITHLTHETETMMDHVRKGTLKLQTHMVDAILESIDATGKLLDLLEEQISNEGKLISPYYDVSATIINIQDILDNKPQTEQTKTQPQPEQQTAKQIQPETQPESNQQSAKKIGEILVTEGTITTVQLDNALEIQNNEQNTRKIGEILVQEEGVPTAQVEKALEIQKSLNIEETIKISVDKLDQLIDMVGELVITGTQVIQNDTVTSTEDSRLINDVRQLTRIIRDIQDISINMRLVTISPLFNKMHRLVRDLSNKLKKEIEIKMSGEDTEIDKNIIDSLGDPLMHLLRNAIDHGVETPDKRIASGKKPKGLIELRAYHKSGYIVIEIKDDGQGLNKDKILKTAIQKGLVKEGEGLSDTRIYNLIFEPGFSTAEQVTDISGRGVGMDVVRKNIEKLRGKVDIESTPGKGTSFIIKLPLTLAIIDGIIMQSGDERYIIPIFSIIEFIQPQTKNISTITQKGELISVHEELFQIIKLNDVFNHGKPNKQIEDMTGCILDSDYGKCCLLVDELIGQQQVVIKSLGDKFKHVQGISGGTILGDGKVGLIIDTNALIGVAKGLTDTKQ